MKTSRGFLAIALVLVVAGCEIPGATPVATVEEPFFSILRCEGSKEFAPAMACPNGKYERVTLTLVMVPGIGPVAVPEILPVEGAPEPEAAPATP